MSAALKQDEDAPAVIRRVGIVDLAGPLLPWLTKRLQEKHAEANAGEIAGWLRGCLFSNQMIFIRTEHAVGLAELCMEPLERQPFAREVFVLAMEGHTDEAVPMYAAMASWAAHQNCSRLEVDNHTDVMRADMKQQVGGFRTKSKAWMHLGRLDA